jgi:RimJ/RimL family protein N-acetyltransferase
MSERSSKTFDRVESTREARDKLSAEIEGMRHITGEMNALRIGSLLLEPQVAAHAAEMFDVLSDAAIYEFENSPPQSRAWLEDRFAKLESRASADGTEQWLNWVIRLPKGALAGYVQATITQDRTAHIAYELASRYWRQGIGSASVSAMISELVASHGAHAFAATLNAGNYRSLSLLRSLGFGPAPPEGVTAVEHESDEIVLYKAVDTGKDGRE